MKQLKIGDCVKFDAPTGSLGIIEADRQYDDGFYVRWYYCKDVKGEYITALSSMARDALKKITLAELDTRRNRQGFDS